MPYGKHIFPINASVSFGAGKHTFLYAEGMKVTDPLSLALGLRIREVRETLLKRSQIEIASDMGVERAAVSGWERGAGVKMAHVLKFADLYGVSVDWLATGRGHMTGLDDRPRARIPLIGLIGAGAGVEPRLDPIWRDAPRWIEVDDDIEAEAYVVEGESMSPRFAPGEVLVFDKKPSDPDALVGQYCLAQMKNDRGPLVKILHAGRSPGLYWLLSHNPASPPIKDVELIYAQRWRGLRPPLDGRPAPLASKKKSGRPKLS